MDFSFFFGADKTPFVFDKNGMIEAESMPFHGIISRGLLNLLQKNNVPDEVWINNAHYLEIRDFNNNSNKENLSMLRKYSAQCKVLSFEQSALSAKLYIESYCDGFQNKNIAHCELWNIKEGHTSSVWKVILTEDDFNEEHFIINVARDYEASVELKTTSEYMKVIAEHQPVANMARVYEIQTINLNLDDVSYDVVVTRNKWVENSYEIHMIKDKLNKAEAFLLVERFLTKKGTPAHISSIHGRKFTKEENVKIKDDIDLFLVSSSSCLSHTPTLNINDGDVVWDGIGAIIVAIS